MIAETSVATADQETKATEQFAATAEQTQRTELTYFISKIYHSVLNIYQIKGPEIKSYKYPLKLYQLNDLLLHNFQREYLRVFPLFINIRSSLKKDSREDQCCKIQPLSSIILVLMFSYFSLQTMFLDYLIMCN